MIGRHASAICKRWELFSLTITYFLQGCTSMTYPSPNSTVGWSEHRRIKTISDNLLWIILQPSRQSSEKNLKRTSVNRCSSNSNISRIPSKGRGYTTRSQASRVSSSPPSIGSTRRLHMKSTVKKIIALNFLLLTSSNLANRLISHWGTGERHETALYYQCRH